MECDVCFHHCNLQEGKTGFCRARMNLNGVNTCINYGKITSAAFDPIEKKPLAHFYPGSIILSVGSYGCNLACPFCQNYDISMTDNHSAYYQEVDIEDLIYLALRDKENLGIAFTYNEPLISYEMILDIAPVLHEHGKKVVLVTNGTANQNILEKVIPHVDAMNIDLKGDETFYKELGGDYQSVRNTIEYVYDKCHLEITTLIIPGKNDSDTFIVEQAQWLSSLDPDIPWHLSRYFPRYKYTIQSTPKETIFHLKNIAQKYMHHVYTGNIW